MKVIIEIPEKFLHIAGFFISENIDNSDEILASTIKKCQGKNVEVNFEDSGLSEIEIFQMNIAMATLAITKAFDDVDFKSKKGGEHENETDYQRVQ